MKKALSLILALVMCLALIPMTAMAGPGADQASATELKAGQSDTFTNAVDIAYYKIDLAVASEVVMTLSMPGAGINEQAWVRTIYGSDRDNAAFAYVGLTGGPLADRELAGDFYVGYHSEKGTVLSKQGTVYLDKGVNVIEIAHSLEDGSSATIKIDSITPVSNSGGRTKESAPTIDPAKAIVKQTRYNRNWLQDESYWKFTLDADATVSIKKTVTLVPCNDDRLNASSLLVLKPNVNNDHDSMWGKVDGEDVVNIELWEKHATLTKTITYVLSKGTYFVVLNDFNGYPGTEYTLEFSVQGGAAAGSMDNIIKVNTYESGQFTDVKETAWYGFDNQKVVSNAFEYGMMKGNSATTFNPAGNITVAEAITMAARVHSIYATGKGEFVQGNPWYQVYVDYCVSNGIIKNNEFTNFTRAATRAEMAYIFSGALPATELESQNTVNSLPDVNSETPYYNAIILLYKAGIVGGSDDKGTFNPSSNIIRAEAAAIISRLILPDTRMSGKEYGK